MATTIKTTVVPAIQPAQPLMAQGSQPAPSDNVTGFWAHHLIQNKDQQKNVPAPINLGKPLPEPTPVNVQHQPVQVQPALTTQVLYREQLDLGNKLSELTSKLKERMDKRSTPAQVVQQPPQQFQAAPQPVQVQAPQHPVQVHQIPPQQALPPQVIQQAPQPTQVQQVPPQQQFAPAPVQVVVQPPEQQQQQFVSAPMMQPQPLMHAAPPGFVPQPIVQYGMPYPVAQQAPTAFVQQPYPQGFRVKM